MLDIKFVRTNPDAVKENIKKKFQDEKIPMGGLPKKWFDVLDGTCHVHLR